MSTEERPPAEECDGRTSGPQHGHVISNLPDASDGGPGPDGAEDDDDEDVDEDDVDVDDEEDTNDVNDPTAEPGKPI